MLERKYDNYDYIPDTPSFIEDSKSGYEYFKRFFPGIRTTYGKDNIINNASLDSTVIADGASIGPVFPLLLSKYKLFLPESFEWLLLRKNGKVPDVSLSINAEKEYTACCKKLPFKYKKGKLNNNLKDRKYIADFEISDALLKDYLAVYKCDISIAELRNLIYNVKGDLCTDDVIKTALVLHTLNKL